MIYIVLNNSPEHGGGVEQAVKNILKNFSNNMEREIILLCCDEKKPKEFFWESYKCINLSVKKNYFLDKLFLYSQLKYSYKIYAFFKKKSKNGDIINIHGVEYAFFLTYFKKKIYSKIKIILTVHGSYFEQYTNFVVKRLPWKFFSVKIFFFFWRWYFFFLEKTSIKSIDKYIFITKHLQLYYSSVFNVKKRLGKVIYNGIKKEKEVFNPKEKDKKKLSAIIVGSNFYLKGLDIALNSIEKINASNSVKKRIKLNVIGFDDFYKFISKKKVPNFVNYVGRVSSNQVGAWIQKSDFLLFPSRHEGFPLSILEAIQLKIPVIVSEACKFEEIPNSEKLGIVVQGYKIKDWEEGIAVLTKKILFFQKNLERLDMKSFFWEKIAEEYLHVFNEEN